MKNVFDKIMFVLLSLILFSCSQDDAVMNDHIVGTNESESEFLTLNSGVQDSESTYKKCLREE